MQTKNTMKVGWLSFFLGLLWICGAAGNAAADDRATIKALLQRLDRLTNQVEDLQSQVRDLKGHGGSTAPVATSDAKRQEPQGAATAAEGTATSQPPVNPASAPLGLPPVRTETNVNGALDPDLFGLTYRSKDALKLGAYGEVRFGSQDTDRGSKNGFDATRIVLLGTYAFTDDILFNTEIEFEHGGIAKDEDDKLDGAVEVEQVFVDFKFNDYINWRAPGVDIVPVGYIGLFHEPTQFYSTERPELYQGLIPATWFEGASSVYGQVTEGLTYQFQVSTGLEDAGTTAPDGDGDVPEEGYEAGISGTEALGLSRASISDRKQLGNNLGYALRVAYSPLAIPGLAGSSSVYYTPNTTPRGGFGTNADGTSFRLGKSDLTMLDTELRYRMPKTGLELRGEYVQTFFGNTQNLRANNDTDPTNNVGDSMYGYSIESAYHLDVSSYVRNGWELVPFYRFTEERLQTGGFAGRDDDSPTGAGKQQFHTAGVALFPTPKLVLKVDYRWAVDSAPNSPNSDHFFGAVGYLF